MIQNNSRAIPFLYGQFRPILLLSSSSWTGCAIVRLGTTLPACRLSTDTATGRMLPAVVRSGKRLYAAQDGPGRTLGSVVVWMHL